MKKNFYYFLTLLSLSALVSSGSCEGKEEITVNLDLLICESPKDNKLTEQQIKMLLPFEKDNIRYLVQGSVLNVKDTISYVKEKGWLDNMGQVQKPLFSEQELVSNHLKGLDLSPLSLEKSLSVDDENRYIAGYDAVLGFSAKQPKNISAYSFTIYTKIEDILSYITDKVLVNNPEAKILIVSNPPIASDTIQRADVPVIKPASTGGTKKTAPYTVSRLNSWLNGIAQGDDAARDKMRKLNTVKVNRAANISNVQQLITDVSNGTRYTVTKVDADGSITVRK